MKLKIIGVLILLIALFYFSYHIIESGQRDAYTALYFSEPTRPIWLDSTENSVRVNFTIENHEGKPINYTYEISLEKENSEVAEVMGKVFLRNEEGITVLEKFFIDATFINSSIISIELTKDEVNETYRRIWHRF